jgi:hypothetical protein
MGEGAARPGDEMKKVKMKRINADLKSGSPWPVKSGIAISVDHDTNDAKKHNIIPNRNQACSPHLTAQNVTNFIH